MPDFSAYDTTNSPTGPEKPRVFGLKVINDIDVLRRNGLGDTVTKVEGYLQAYDRGGGKIAFRVEMLDCNKEALNFPKFSPVATGSLLALHDDNEGVLEEDDTTKRTAKGGAAAGRRVYYGQYDIDGGHYVRHAIPMNEDDFNGSTAKTNGVTGFVFDDGTDAWVFITDPMPFDYTAGHDSVLELLVKIDQAETDTDVIDFKVRYASIALGIDALGGTTTTVAVVDQGPIGSGGTAIHTLHRVLISLPYDDGTNPIGADDMLRIEVLRNGLNDVDSVTLFKTNLLVPQHGGVDVQL